jgi:hypothetical protein
LAGLTLANDTEVIDLEEIDELDEGTLTDTITNQFGTHNRSKFIKDQSQSDKCDDSEVDSGFCWNDKYLANGLIHHIEAEFYDKYVYGPSMNPVSEVPSKADMEVDTNPAAPWLIMFVKDRFNLEKNHAEMMQYAHHLLWESKQDLHESVNLGFVDVHSVEGELIKHTFDVTSIPNPVLVKGGNYWTLPWSKTHWDPSDIEDFIVTNHEDYDKQPLRPAVTLMPGLYIEYANAYVAETYFKDLLQAVIEGNKLCKEYTGYKVDFKQGYEHFGKKNKYRNQQVRHLANMMMWPVIGLVGFVLMVVFCLVRCLCKCVCRCLCGPKKEKDE